MPNRKSFLEFRNDTPVADNFIMHSISADIFDYFSVFIRKKKDLTIVAIQNPFGKNENLKEIEESFSSEIKDEIEVLNKIKDSDPEIFKNIDQHKKIFLVYLSTLKILFDNLEKHPEYKKFITEKQVEYAINALEEIHISKIRDELDDSLFKYLHADIYDNYISLIEYTRETYKSTGELIRNSFKKLMSNAGIEGNISTRMKSIHSIHNKITKKNILFSQVLDAIGVRFILKNEKDCYRLMSLISQTYSVLNNRIKDYIAIPKENNYQSIHLTIMYKSTPIEIQIRTEEMNKYAEYGDASHVIYKQK